jgi:hypothetical protein
MMSQDFSIWSLLLMRERQLTPSLKPVHNTREVRHERQEQHEKGN